MKTRYVITASCFDKKGRLISTGQNDYKKSSTFMKRWAELAGEPYKIYWHSECRAIYRALKQGKDIHSIVVTRYDSKGNFRNAKPCKTCMACIRFFNIPFIYFSTEEGIIEWNLNLNHARIT